MLKLTHPNPSPSLTGLPQCCEDQLQTTLLGLESRNGLGTSLLLDKGSFQQISCANTPMMNIRTTKVRPAGFQIIGEGLHRRWVQVLVALQQVFSNHLAHFTVRSIVGAVHHGLDFFPGVIRHLVNHVADLMSQAALSKAVGPRFIDRSDQSRCTVGGNQYRCRQPSSLHVPDEILPGGVALLIAQGHVQKHLLTVPADPPGHQNTFLHARQASQRLIDPSRNRYSTSKHERSRSLKAW